MTKDEKLILFEKVQKLVPYIISQYTVEPADVEDLTQAAYYKLWLRLDKYDPKRGKPTTYAHWVVTSVVLHYFNKTNKKVKFEQSLDKIMDNRQHVPEQLEDRRAVRAQQINDKFNQVLSLPVFDGTLGVKVREILKLMRDGYKEDEAIKKLGYDDQAKKLRQERLRIYAYIREHDTMI